MKKIAIALLLVIGVTFGLTSPIAAASPARVAAGGTVNIQGSFWTFSFQAVQVDSATGMARGKFNFIRNPGAQSFIKGEVLYLWIHEDKAWIGFIITNTNDPAYSIDQEIVFEVQDNPDRISDPKFEMASNAVLEQDLLSSTASFDWTHGNIQIKKP